MPDYEQIEEVVAVPPEAGVEGFILTLRGILKLPRVQGVRIDTQGNVHYTYFLRKGEAKKAMDLDFESVSPYSIVRNGEVQEVLEVDLVAPIAIAWLFHRVAMDHLYPVAFVGGAKSAFWPWFESTSNIKMAPRDNVFGLPFYSDRHLDDTTLILACSYGKHAGIIDTRKSYKLLIPQVAK